MDDYSVLHDVYVLAICIKPVVYHANQSMDLLLSRATNWIFNEKMDYKPICSIYRMENHVSRFLSALVSIIDDSIILRVWVDDAKSV